MLTCARQELENADWHSLYSMRKACESYIKLTRFVAFAPAPQPSPAQEFQSFASALEDFIANYVVLTMNFSIAETTNRISFVGEGLGDGTNATNLSNFT